MITKDQIAKGESILRLIELIKSVQTKGAEDLSKLNEAIEAVREMFKSDEMTIDTFANISAMQTAGELEPGHMYQTVSTTNSGTVILTALNNNTFATTGYYDGRPAVIDPTTGEVVKYLDALTDPFIGSTTVSSVTNIPVTKSTVIANIATDETVSFTEGLPEGREVYVIAKNDSGSAVTLTFTDSNIETVTVDDGAYAEFSVINIAGDYFVRVGVDQEEVTHEEITADHVNNMLSA